MHSSSSHAEQIRHKRAVEQLCRKYPQHSQQIQQMYEERMDHYPANLPIRTYLSIFISRDIEEFLRQQQSPAQHH